MEEAGPAAKHVRSPQVTANSASGTKPHREQHRELDRRIAALALPALGSIAAEPAYSLADTAIVGHLGRVPLDSLAIATTALNMTAWLAIFLTTATTSAIAGLAARRATQQAARTAGAAYLVAAAAGVIVALAVLAAAPGIAALLGARQLVFGGSVSYLRASAAGLPFLYLSYAATATSSGWPTSGRRVLAPGPDTPPPGLAARKSRPCSGTATACRSARSRSAWSR